MSKSVIFDIDGTLADLTHRRHWVATKPKNWKAFFAGISADGVHQRVVDTVWDFYRAGYVIILCSGRGEDHRVVTQDWLAKHDIPWGKLYMRKEKDYRADDIVKSELLDQILADGYDPSLVFDDRNRVVAMWRKRGYIVHQVAEGDF